MFGLAGVAPSSAESRCAQPAEVNWVKTLALEVSSYFLLEATITFLRFSYHVLFYFCGRYTLCPRWKFSARQLSNWNACSFLLVYEHVQESVCSVTEIQTTSCTSNFLMSLLNMLTPTAFVTPNSVLDCTSACNPDGLGLISGCAPLPFGVIEAGRWSVINLGTSGLNPNGTVQCCTIEGLCR